MKPSAFTEEQKEWLLKVAWKKMTLNQISDELKINPSTISAFYKKHNIEPMTQRDLITRDIFALLDKGHVFKNIRSLSAKLNCSDNLVKSIVDDLCLLKENTPKALKGINISKDIKQLDAELKKREEEKKERRSKLTKYTQTGSDILDDLRQTKTTERSAKLLSNGGLQ